MSSPPKKRKRTPSFKIELSGDENKKISVLENLQKLRSELEIKLNKHVGNLHRGLLGHWQFANDLPSGKESTKPSDL